MKGSVHDRIMAFFTFKGICLLPSAKPDLELV